ncbi:hypothetical protein BCR44DRAFT_122410 [Catenaria anguillulae PL171]|uniref:Methyltransferase domain-containing protein n=1 Tax=Catenaria anguillulae PL171 TaxID=765915 RepID=A0A1Y2HFW7_9FUNG|nr:hypothetical protein BCR44DRAFT_122410 [Catenaria anguillulae PL171]
MHPQVPPPPSSATAPAARRPAAPTSAATTHSAGPIRSHYQSLGVQGFYASHGATYRNPHFMGVRTCLRTLLSKWVALDGQLSYPVLAQDDGPCRMLDLAAGSGEATQIVNEWVQEQTSNIMAGIAVEWTAMDPYTQDAYVERIGQPCLPISFQDIAAGLLDTSSSCSSSIPESWDLVICSFALHLIDASLMYGVLSTLARRARFLIVLSPSKKPEIKPSMGWALVAEAYTGGTGNNRVHGWLFESQLYSESE